MVGEAGLLVFGSEGGLGAIGGSVRLPAVWFAVALVWLMAVVEMFGKIELPPFDDCEGPGRPDGKLNCSSPV